MTQNNVGVLYKYNGAWYVFDVPVDCEEDAKAHGYKLFLEITAALGPYQTYDEACQKAPNETKTGAFTGGMGIYGQIGVIQLRFTYHGKLVKREQWSMADDMGHDLWYYVVAELNHMADTTKQQDIAQFINYVWR